ncbi:hypothetical protein [uncultured Corynebacterium sp.]|uniref:hypothetical protein n=1 Tax=uncultured Corynebacterium sp. TaxID=159447 RepID=UPI002630D603|nr:hypothetical protein [uncultured Corynebacterium sp.]
MKVKYPFWLRFIEGTPSGEVGGGSTADESKDGNESPKGAEREKRDTSDDSGKGDSDGGDEDDSDGENGAGRGSKRAVLGDLAKERDKRQEWQTKAKNAEFENERLKGEKKDLETRFAEMAEKISAMEKFMDSVKESERIDRVKTALSDAHLPAEMADRVRGETLEEIAKDVQELSKLFGFDKRPLDPSQGWTSTGKGRLDTSRRMGLTNEVVEDQSHHSSVAGHPKQNP